MLSALRSSNVGVLSTSFFWRFTFAKVTCLNNSVAISRFFLNWTTSSDSSEFGSPLACKFFSSISVDIFSRNSSLSSTDPSSEIWDAICSDNEERSDWSSENWLDTLEISLPKELIFSSYIFVLSCKSATKSTLDAKIPLSSEEKAFETELSAPTITAKIKHTNEIWSEKWA